MKNKYNIEEIEHNKADSSRGFFVVCLATSKKIDDLSCDDLSCDDFKALYSGYTCKELKAMYKLENDIKY
mgnify:CR=1 FL=1